MPTATAPARPATRKRLRAPEGIITALVAVTGVKDHVDDVIVPGAFARTFGIRRPKVVFHHDWLRFLGRSLTYVELMPGDPRLPKRTKEGKPWPKDAGGVVAVMEFNLKVEAGRDGYEWAKFYTESNECEWSIGYKVVPGKASKGRDGLRYIYDLDVYEFSLVLFGAASLSMTMDVKDLQGHDDLEAKAVPFGAVLRERVLQEFMQDALERKSAEKAAGTGVMVALYPPADIAGQLAVDDGSPADDLHVTLAYLGDAEDLPADPQDLVEVVREGLDAFEAMDPLTGTVGGLGQFPAGPDGTPTYVPVDVPGLSRRREAIVDAIEASPFSSAFRRDHGFTPHMTLGYDVDADPVPATDVTFDEVFVVVGPDRYPVSLTKSGVEMETKKLPKTQTCSEKGCTAKATKRVLWAEGMAYQPACPKHVEAVKRRLKKDNGKFGDIDGVQDIPEAKSAAVAVLEAKGLPVTYGHSAFDAVREAKAMTERDDGRGVAVRRSGGSMVGPGTTRPGSARKPAVRAAGTRPRSAATGSFDESKHKRAGVGQPNGGQFIAKGSGYEATGKQDEAEDVTKAQSALIAAGLLGEKDGKQGKGDDGLFGRKTEAAVKKWQKQQGYDATGNLSGDQYDELTGGKAGSTRGRSRREGGEAAGGGGRPAGRQRRSSAPDRYGRTDAPIKDRQGRPKYMPDGKTPNPDYGQPTGKVTKRSAGAPAGAKPAKAPARLKRTDPAFGERTASGRKISDQEWTVELAKRKQALAAEKDPAKRATRQKAVDDAAFIVKKRTAVKKKAPAARAQPIGKKRPGPAPSAAPARPVGRPKREFGQRTSDRSRLQTKSAWDTIAEARLPAGLLSIDQYREREGLEVKYDTSSTASPGKDNWIEQVDGKLDPFIRAVRNALMRERGKTESEAHEIAIGTIRRWAAGGGDVTDKTRAKAVKAIAAWEALKAKAKATPPKMESKMMHDLPGSFEQQRDLIRTAVQEMFSPPRRPQALGEAPAVLGMHDECYVSVDGTYPSHVVVTVEKAGASTTYQVPYVFEDGAVGLGEAEEVKLKVVVEETGADADDEETAAVRFADPAAKMLDEVSHLVMIGGAEGKSAEVLRPALLQLLDSLAMKGMPDVLDADDDKFLEDDREPVDVDSGDVDPAEVQTPEGELADPPAEDVAGAELEGKADDIVTLDPDEVARELEALSLT